MKNGFLSQYFEGVAAKILSKVEVNVLASNQHELNGVEGLRRILGEPTGKIRYQTKLMYFTDFDDEPITEDGEMTWYDARQKARLERNVERYEYRLYFTTNTVMQAANAGDLWIIAKQKGKDQLLAIVAEQGTTIASQLLWLFGFSSLAHAGFSVREETELEQDRIAFASRIILENIGIEVEVSEGTYLDEMLRRFHGVFPTTRESAAYTRETLGDFDYTINVDDALMACYEREDILFRTLEKHIVGERLQKGFTDVDDFFAFAKSTQNRRKSRAGLSFENHLEFLFQKNSIRYDRTPETERRAKPDFLFPGISEYRNKNFPELKLSMLGVKTTCKDRWRQVLQEADRIATKHILTLESAISVNQTDEMQSLKVQLVLPQKIHTSYKPEQQKWLMSLNDFFKLVGSRQV